MTFKCIKLVSVAAALIMSTSMNAAIIDNDTYTTDTDTGLHWLDLTKTAHMSVNQILSSFYPGGQFEGWRYATELEIVGLFDAFGGNSDYYQGWSTQNNGLFDRIAPLWGDLTCAYQECQVGQGGSSFFYDEWAYTFNEIYLHPGGNYIAGDIDDYWAHENNDVDPPTDSATHDSVSLPYTDYGNDFRSPYYGHALVRNTFALPPPPPIPVPAAVWLFGSGLLGLIGVARRKKIKGIKGAGGIIL